MVTKLIYFLQKLYAIKDLNSTALGSSWLGVTLGRSSTILSKTVAKELITGTLRVSSALLNSSLLYLENFSSLPTHQGSCDAPDIHHPCPTSTSPSTTDQNFPKTKMLWAEAREAGPP